MEIIRAAWQYEAAIDDERIEESLRSGAYRDATSDVRCSHRGLWFQDESFVVAPSGPTP